MFISLLDTQQFEYKFLIPLVDSIRQPDEIDKWNIYALKNLKRKKEEE